MGDCGVLSNRAGGVLGCSRGSASESLETVAPHVPVLPAVAAISRELAGVAAAAAATTTTSLAFTLAAGLALGAGAASTSSVTGMFSFAAASAFARFRAAVTDKVAGSVTERAFRTAEIRVVLPEA